ncbi:MAG: hypothetical protein BWX80_03608 [Candidatus Hydrogenedentes bacterium ADurb.Bin101]|nr:MAG: hypothetical protein BWX80_03608 [Candidatus Hydrogenedentes bacterium ADurb.Bin101]
MPGVVKAGGGIVDVHRIAIYCSGLGIIAGTKGGAVRAVIDLVNLSGKPDGNLGRHGIYKTVAAAGNVAAECRVVLFEIVTETAPGVVGRI